jgi:DNA-binding CsgD family transcriptional regulator/tetratricopeptide (TPR) repeat protein
MSLLERERPMAELLSAVERMSVDGGRVVALVGEAGIGKTSVLDFVARQVCDRVRVLWAGCEALFTPRPLGPLHDIASELGIDAGAPRERLFPEVLAAARREPTLLVVEDVHWADHATLDLLKYLARRIVRAPVVLALSYRDDEITPDHPLVTLLGEAGTALRRIALEPLSRQAVESLAAGRAGVFELTGGNPFFVTEVLESEGDGIPPLVRDAVLARAAKLTAAARQVLEIASLMPGRAELALLGAPVEMGLDSGVEAVEAAAHCGIVRVEDGAIVFRHELARRAVEDSISEIRRRTMHGAILHRLVDRGESSLARLAHHATGSRETEGILLFLPLAAVEAASAGAHREAAAHLRNVLPYAANAPDVERAELFESLSYECYFIDGLEEALAHRLEATAIWRRLGDRRREGDNLRWQSRLNWFLGRNAEARRRAAEAIDILQQEPPGRELAMACSNQSQLHFLAQENALAIEWGMRAIQLATTLGDHEILAHALNNVGSAAVNSGDADGFEGLEESLRLSLQCGYQEHAGRAYANLFSQSIRLRDYASAERFLPEALEYFHTHDLDSRQIYIIAWRARMHLERGRWDEAVADAQAVLAHDSVSPINRIPALAVLGTVRTRRGDPSAQALLDEARDLAERTAEIQRIAPVALARAEAAWLRGDCASAVEDLRLALAVADRIGETAERHDLQLWLWRVGGCEAAPPPRAPAGDAYGDSYADPYEEALALGDRGDVDSLRRAIAILERLGDNCLVHLLRQKLRARGVRGPRHSTRTNPGGLTEREMDIAALLVDGLRNAEIAARLNVSPKTVDHHVSAVLAKLGVRSRGEAARVLRSRK